MSSRINVLGNGFVEIVDSMGSDLTVVNAARVSLNKSSELFDEKDEKLIEYLLANQHGSPFEHTSLTFRIKLPLFVMRQLVRHRIGTSINEISGRYVELKEEYWIPLEFRKQSKSDRQASDSWDVDESESDDMKAHWHQTMSDCFTLYKSLLSQGVAREQARAVLPLATYTEIYWTCNLRSLFHFLSLRDSEHAQYEIREYAKALIQIAKEFFPTSVKKWEELKTKKPTKQATLVFGLLDGKELSINVGRDIKEIDLSQCRIVTIPENICELTKLQKLYLSHNQIVDIKPLARLTSLTELDLDHNNIVNIEPLARLINLRWLCLSGNDLVSIEALKNLINLEKLYLIYSMLDMCDHVDQLKEALPNTIIYYGDGKKK